MENCDIIPGSATTGLEMINCAQMQSSTGIQALVLIVLIIIASVFSIIWLYSRKTRSSGILDWFD